MLLDVDIIRCFFSRLLTFEDSLKGMLMEFFCWRVCGWQWVVGECFRLVEKMWSFIFLTWFFVFLANMVRVDLFTLLLVLAVIVGIFEIITGKKHCCANIGFQLICILNSAEKELWLLSLLQKMEMVVYGDLGRLTMWTLE